MINHHQSQVRVAEWSRAAHICVGVRRTQVRDCLGDQRVTSFFRNDVTNHFSGALASPVTQAQGGEVFQRWHYRMPSIPLLRSSPGIG